MLASIMQLLYTILAYIVVSNKYTTSDMITVDGNLDFGMKFDEDAEIPTFVIDIELKDVYTWVVVGLQKPGSLIGVNVDNMALIFVQENNYGKKLVHLQVCF